MKLTEIHVDGFGVWRDLRLRKLSPEITVFYGPNEAGKTTLMHFLRAMLYGVTPERRERYLPPREGGRPGGEIGLVSDDGPFEAARYCDRGDDDRGRVTVTLPDGEEQGDRMLREALEEVDEQTFSNVFAIGLDEINELGALEGAEAARWIYRLTSGLDRVSLYDVIQGLRSSRHNLIGPAGESSVLGDLFASREQLETEIGELAVGNRRWAKLAIEVDEANAQTEQLETELKQTERRARRIEIALGLKPLWSDRNRVIDDRLRYDHLMVLPENALATLDELNTRTDDHQRKRDILRGQRRQLHEEVQELDVNEVLVRSCCRLDALGEQQEWLEALERQSENLSEKAERYESRINSESARLAKLWRHKPKAEDAPALDDETLDSLRPAAEAVRDAEQYVEEARRELDHRRGDERKYLSQMESALTSSEKLGLPNDIEEAGDLVSLLRRRQKAEQRLEQTKRQSLDLEQTNRDLIDRQVIPIEWFTLLTTAFILSAIMAVWPFLQGSPVVGGWSVFGFFSCIGLIFARFMIEDQAADQLDGCRQEFELAERQIEEAQQERDTLEADLPLQEGSVVLRLQNAERHLSELEKMLPVETERRRANQHATSAEEQYRSAKEELAKAEREWKTALRSVGLPDETTASELEKLAVQHQSLAELRSKHENRLEEVERCELEYSRVAKRIAALAEEADLVVEDSEPLEQLEHLLSERRLQQSRIDHRKKIFQRARDLRDKQRKHTKAAERIDAEREVLFRAAGVDGEEAYRQLAADWTDAGRLDEKRERLTREISAAIGKSGTEEDFAELLSPQTIAKLDGQWETLTAEHTAIEKQLRELVARQVELEKEQQVMVEDTSLADKRVELDLIHAQVTETQERWRERAAVGAMLELIRNDYEEHRQPETLLEASKYLERLTRGRYPRVWTPLADDVLFVDNLEGESIAVENLSRGAREQLFLSVRMALVAMYARRGVQLPMILDDVLVNFDDGRSQIAANVLTDFAKEGHQLFVFTCHEHVWEMFKELRTDVRRLPVRYAEDVIEEEPIIEEVVVEEVLEEPVAPAVVKKPRKRRKPKPAPVEVPSYVEAEYETIEPLTVTETIVEEVVKPATPLAKPTFVEAPLVDASFVEAPFVEAEYSIEYSAPVESLREGASYGVVYGEQPPVRYDEPLSEPWQYVGNDPRRDTGTTRDATSDWVTHEETTNYGADDSWIDEAEEAWSDDVSVER